MTGVAMPGKDLARVQQELVRTGASHDAPGGEATGANQALIARYQTLVSQAA